MFWSKQKDNNPLKTDTEQKINCLIAALILLSKQPKKWNLVHGQLCAKTERGNVYLNYSGNIALDSAPINLTYEQTQQTALIYKGLITDLALDAIQEIYS